MSEINTWPGWESVRKLGEGSFGSVYEIRRVEFGKEYKAALKVITIPKNASELKSAYSEGMDEKSATEYFRSMVEDITAEFALMSDLRGHSNIVSYEDHMVIQHEEGIGWDILIRMELLTSLLDYVKTHPMREKDVLKLGCDICRGLEVCEKHDPIILHRDIKPENIFVNSNGDFKLGDFGIARTVEKTMSMFSKKGTYSYMAPEVYLGKPYGQTADIYSLGMVLYKYLNNNRLPFLPENVISYTDYEKALQDRVSGKPIPQPAHGSGITIYTVLQALVFDPGKRFQSAKKFRDALEQCISSEEYTGTVRDCPVSDSTPEPAQNGEQKHVVLKTALVAAVLIFVFLSGFYIRGVQSLRANIDEEPSNAVTTTETEVFTEPASTDETEPHTEIHTEQTANDITAANTDAVSEHVVIGKKGTLNKTKLRGWVNPPDVKEIVILSSLDTAPGDAEDLSDDNDGSVLAWMDGSTLYLAGRGGIYAPEDSSYLFSIRNASKSENANQRWENLRSVSGAEYLDTSKVTNMRDIFYFCKSLRDIDVSQWDVSNVTNMRSIFLECSSLLSVDVSNWDISRVSNLQLAFGYCSTLTDVDVSRWNLSSADTLESMFDNCASLAKVDVENWKTTSVTNMRDMFSNCLSLTDVDVSRWDTSSVTDMRGMFYHCESLTNLEMSRWNISNVQQTDQMFTGTIWENDHPYPFD